MQQAREAFSIQAHVPVSASGVGAEQLTLEKTRPRQPHFKLLLAHEEVRVRAWARLACLPACRSCRQGVPLRLPLLSWLSWFSRWLAAHAAAQTDQGGPARHRRQDRGRPTDRRTALGEAS